MTAYKSVPGWSVRSIVHDSETSLLVIMSRWNEERQEYEEEPLWVNLETHRKVWGAYVDSYGYVRGPDGEKLE